MTHHEYIEVPQDQASGSPYQAELLDQTSQIAVIVNATVATTKAPIWAGEIGPHNGKSPGCNHSSMRWATYADTNDLVFGRNGLQSEAWLRGLLPPGFRGN